LSQSEFKVVLMVLVVFSFLGLFGLIEIIKELIAKLNHKRKPRRLYQGSL